MQSFGMDKYEFRRVRLLNLKRDVCGDSAAELARKIDRDSTYVLRMLYPEGKKGKKKIGDDMVDVINHAFPGWLDADNKSRTEGVTPYNKYPNSIDVHVFDAEASMGPGRAQPENDTVVGSMQLNPSWVRQQLPSISSPNNLSVLTAYGDSMSPTFSDGDMLLVDRGSVAIDKDAVFVLSFNQELFVKRVQRRPFDGALVIKSDNPLYDPHVLANGERESLQVLGRVVWAWNGRKL